MKMPNPIAIRFAKLIFSILSITVLGVIFAMISHDHKMPRIRRKEDLPDVMTMPLVAKTLGCSLTVAYRLLKRDDFPHTVSGQRVYIDKGKFLSWLDAQTQMEKRDHYGW